MFSSLMSLIIVFLLQTLTLTLTLALPLPLWPKPTSLHWPIPSFSPLSPNFLILPPSPLNPHLHSSILHYSHLLQLCHHHHHRRPPNPYPNPNPSTTPLPSLSLLISDLSSPLSPSTDESYTLSILPSNATLASATIWGAMRGLATFSQLVFDHPPLVASDLIIHDKPRFPHRGILLDTSRNFYPVRDIKRTIDAMSWNKLNVFHWHVTDSHSFPLVLPSEPELARRGAYGEGMRYEVRDVMEVVEHGLSRGVRVVPEIDMPGECHNIPFKYTQLIPT